MRPRKAFLFFIFLFLFFCEDIKDKDKNIVAINDIKIMVDDQEINFLKPTSGLRFNEYGLYYISDIFLMDKEPPRRLTLFKEEEGTIEIIQKTKNKIAVININHQMMLKILNYSWVKILCKGYQDENKYCTIYLIVGKSK